MIQMCAVAFVITLIGSPLYAQDAATVEVGPPDAAPVSQHSKGKDTTQAKGKEATPERPWRFRWDDHPSLYFGTSTRIDLRARVQAHLRDSDAPIGDASAFDVARRRVGVEGRIAGTVDFQVEYEIGNQDPWRDVYADYRRFTSIRIQAGKFKLPFSLEENTGATNLDFVYRSRAATQLAPGRDRGAMAHGRVVNGVIQYELGMFDHDGRNARTSNTDRVSGERTLAGRLGVQPFRGSKTLLRDLHVAIAFTDSHLPEGIAALRGRTALDASFFPTYLWVQGARRRAGVEARWRPGPFSVSSEYIHVTTERLGQSVEDTDLSPLIAAGWYVSGTWLATGEQKSAGADKPRHPLFRGGFGAVELAARMDALAFSSAARSGEPSTSPRADFVLRNEDRAATVGVNWYPYRGIKIQGNLIRESISDPSRGPLPSKPAFWSRVLRFQFTI
jgi:phosphate-selective porin